MIIQQAQGSCYDVERTAIRRDNIISTSVRCHSDVICPLYNKDQAAFTNYTVNNLKFGTTKLNIKKVLILFVSIA